MNRTLQSSDSPSSRAPLVAEVIQVSEQAVTLDPVAEVAEVQRMINTHNQAVQSRSAPHGTIPLAIKRTVFYTGYLISPTDTERLLSLVKKPSGTAEHDIRNLANNIMITPRPAGASILNKVGGIGRKLTWRVTGFSLWENKVWAARVEPTDPTAKIYSENNTPHVCLALRRNARPIDAKNISNWQPVPEHEAFEFETVVGEKVLLRIEEERLGEDDWDSSFPSTKNVRKHPREEDFPPLGEENQNFRGKAHAPRDAPQFVPQQQNAQAMQFGGQQQAPRQHGRGGGGGGNERFKNSGGGGRGGGGGNNARGGRGGFSGRGGRGGNGRGGGRGGRGRGGGSYRSLDDSVANSYSGGSGGMQY